MGNSPYDFVMNVTQKDFKKLENKAVHRTFSAEDFQQFILNLKSVYTEFESLENVYSKIPGFVFCIKYSSSPI